MTRLARRPYARPLLISHTVHRQKKDILGLSSATIQALGLHSNQIIRVESVAEDGGSDHAGGKLCTILRVDVSQTEDGYASISNDTLYDLNTAHGGMITLHPLNDMKPITEVTISLVDEVEKIPSDIISDVLRSYFLGQQRPIHERSRFRVDYGGRPIAFQIVRIDDAEYGIVNDVTNIHFNVPHTQSTDQGFNGDLGSRDDGRANNQPRPGCPAMIKLENVRCKGFQFVAVPQDTGTIVSLKNVVCEEDSCQIISSGSNADIVKIIGLLSRR